MRLIGRMLHSFELLVSGRGREEEKDERERGKKERRGRRRRVKRGEEQSKAGWVGEGGREMWRGEERGKEKGWARRLRGKER